MSGTMAKEAIGAERVKVESRDTVRPNTSPIHQLSLEVPILVLLSCSLRSMIEKLSDEFNTGPKAVC